MNPFRAKLSYANVVATLALFVALGGSSYAAIAITGKNVKDSSLTGRDIKNSSLTTSDVKNRSLLAQDFKAGQLPAGPKGDTGAAGAAGAAGKNGQDGQDGQDGLDGSPGASPVLGRIIGVTTNGSITAAGPSGAQANQGDFARGEQLAPSSFTARDLHAHLQLQDFAGTSVNATGYRIALENDTTGGELACTFTGSSYCDSGSSTMSVSAGDKLVMGANCPPSSTCPASAGTDVLFGWRAEAP
jgi:hypothetical protein